MADPATQQLKIQIKTVGQAGLSKLASSLRGINGIAKQSKIDFGSINKQLNNTNKTMIRSANNVKKLRDAFEEQARSLDRTTKEFKEATQAAKQLDKELAKMEGRRRSGGGLRGAAQTIGTVAGAGVFGGFEGAAGALIGAGFGPAGAIVGGAVGAQVNQLRGALGATAAYSAELEKQRIALVGVTTSNAEYASAISAVKQATEDYALPQDIVLRQFTKLQASVQGAGGDVEDTKIVFDGMVAAVRATGGSLQDVDSALTATAQVFSKGKVSAEELRQQIGERLPGAFTLFAESMKMTPAELDKALEDGKVTLVDFMGFVKANIDRYKENAKAIADSPAAAGDRLKRDLGELSESVGKLLAPIGAAFQEIFSEIAKVILGATQALNRFFGLAFDEAKYEEALMRIADYEALEMTGELPSDKRSRNAAAQRYRQALETVRRQTALMQGPGAGVVRPTKGTGLAYGDPALDGSGSSKKARQDLTVAQLEARRALRAATEAEAIIRLEYESKVLDIMQRQLLERERIDALEEAKAARDKKLEKLQQRRTKALEKERKEYEKLIDSFSLKGSTQFDLNAKGEGPKTPFDMFREGADEFTDSLKGALEASKELASVGLKGISDGITELVVNGTLNFREFAASLLRDMARIIMQQIVVKSLMQAIGFGGGGVDLSSYALANAPQYSAAGVNIGSSAFGLPGFAKGGITRGPSIAGEAGPEAVVPLPDGRSIPVMMSGTGTGNVVVNVDAKGTSVQGDSTRSNALGEAIGSAVRQELIRQRRPGGLLA